MKINELIRQDPERREKYLARVRDARKAMDALGWGSRSECARDLNIHPSGITDILNENRVSLVGLERIEDWLNNEDPGIHM